MIIVSYYTAGSGYEQEAERLKASLDKFNLKYDIQGIEDQGGWMANIRYKPVFILEMLEKHNEPVLWLDADAVVRQEPTLLYDANCDIAFHYLEDREVYLGTFYCNCNDTVKALLKDWIDFTNRRPGVTEQKSLKPMITGKAPWAKRLSRLLLPASYARIFDRPSMEGIEPVIEHFQASRRLGRTLFERIASWWTRLTH